MKREITLKMAEEEGFGLCFAPPICILHIVRYARQGGTGKTAGCGHDLGTAGKFRAELRILRATDHTLTFPITGGRAGRS
jgi:hypothetical protein